MPIGSGIVNLDQEESCIASRPRHHSYGALCNYATVPAKSRPEVNLLPSPNASIPPGNPHSSTQVGAAHSQTNPERAYGQAHLRGGEANTTTEIDTGLALMGPYGPYRLWLPNGWFDWSVFHLGDTDGEEET